MNKTLDDFMAEFSAHQKKFDAEHGELKSIKEMVGKSIQIDAINNVGHRGDASDVGSWVAVRPCGGTSDKTYLGVLLGDMMLDVQVSYSEKSCTLFMQNITNPAIYVFDLNRVVWGAGSWWGRLKSPEGLRSITTADIDSAWYVKALKDLTEKA